MRIRGRLVEIAQCPSSFEAPSMLRVRLTLELDARELVAMRERPEFNGDRDLGKLVEVRDAAALEHGDPIRPAERPRTLTPARAVRYAEELEEERDAWRRRVERLEARLRDTQAQLELAHGRASVPRYDKGFV